MHEMGAIYLSQIASQDVSGLSLSLSLPAVLLVLPDDPVLFLTWGIRLEWKQCAVYCQCLCLTSHEKNSNFLEFNTVHLVRTWSNKGWFVFYLVWSSSRQSVISLVLDFFLGDLNAVAHMLNLGLQGGKVYKSCLDVQPPWLPLWSHSSLDIRFWQS